MLSSGTTKALILDVPGIVSIDVNVCRANVIKYFLIMLEMNDVHQATYETRFVCKKCF